MEEKKVLDESSAKLSRGERKRLQRETSKEQKKFEQDRLKKESGKKDYKLYAIIGICALLLVGAVFGFTKLASGNNDKLAECLEDKGVVIYGNDWCQYTQRQKNLFGNSFSKLNYVVCDENAKLCDDKRIRITPTWEINGQMVEEVQPLRSLAALAGCSL